MVEEIKRDYSTVNIHSITGWSRPESEAEPYSQSGGFIIRWSMEGFGFGEISFKQTGEPQNPQFECDSECMSKEFVEAVLTKLVQIIKLR